MTSPAAAYISASVVKFLLRKNTNYMSKVSVSLTLDQIILSKFAIVT
jgi:hypothetical protein